MSSAVRRRVLLLNPPSDRLVARDKYCTSISKSFYYWPQVDLLAQSGWLAQRHEIGVVDAVVEGLDERACFERIRRQGYDATIFLTSAATWPADFRFAARLKRELGHTTIANGGFLLFQAESALRRHAAIDAVMLDFTTDDALAFLEGDLDRIRHLTYRRDGQLVLGQPAGSQPYSHPVPRHDAFPLQRYRFPLSRREPFTTVLASMGCPHSCSFCVPGAWGYRSRVVDNVLEELDEIHGQGIPEVLFQDPCFGAVAEDADELLDGMIDRRLALGWSCQTRVDRVDEERIAKMRRAGCHTIQFGVESGDQAVLDSTAKGIRLEDVRRAFAQCREGGIRTNAFYIIGLPGDDERSIRATIDLAVELDSDFAVFSLPMPQVGTPLGRAANPEAQDLLETTMDDASRPVATLSGISPRALWRLRNLAYRKFYFRPRYIARRARGLGGARELLRHARAAVWIARRG